MKKLIITTFLVILGFTMIGQEAQYQESDLEIGKFIEGTLTLPTVKEANSLIIFIQGSGPTDRNGNQPMMTNDGMKKMSRELATNGIASFRYDKRIFKMEELKLKEEDLTFDDMAMDAREIIGYFKDKDQFENIVIAGHSQGSLVGILASDDNTDAFISLAGAGEPIDNIIVGQVMKMAPQLGDNARNAFAEMKAEGKTSNYSPMLESLFRPNIQPYMLSWMKYDPAEEISKLEIPVLIINGTADIQVDVEQAEKLASANENSKLVILENMNHIFREIETKDRLVNTKSYNEPNQPLHPELISVITDFINELD
ncbi:alpha/beta hydrolase family protein [Christiangramia sabulilitoris]|uniref:Alpha/beta hydrolase n=1 Tax=Christiangramia sabulilitoris TaxID=2583991 RepID=A0A550I328_9FLAO|nr:alpha/beta hydrolase [Christiangramia sabulilitoris]TRO65387.1 alpha/beta hydrolase [Christiangramia sabulilitoris]